MKKNTMTATAYGVIKDFAVSCRIMMDYATRRHLADVAEEARIYDGGYHSSPSINRLLSDIRTACLDSEKFPPADLISRANTAVTAYELVLTRNDKREKCAAAGRELRQLQKDYRAEVMEEMLTALENVLAEFVHVPGDVKGNKERTTAARIIGGPNAALARAREAIAKAKGE